MITIKPILIVCSLLAFLPLCWSQYFPVTTNPCKCANSGGGPEFVFTNGVICNWDVFQPVKDIYYTGDALMYITMPFGTCWNVTSGSLNCICQHMYGFDLWDWDSMCPLAHWYETFRLPEDVTFNYQSWLVIEWPKLSWCQKELGGPDHPGKTDDGRYYGFEINEVYSAELGNGYIWDRRWCAIMDGSVPWTAGVPYPYEVRDLAVGKDPYFDGWGNPWNESICGSVPQTGNNGFAAQSATLNMEEVPTRGPPNVTELILQRLRERETMSDEDYAALEARKAFEALDSDNPHINKTFVELMIARNNLTRPINSTDPMA